MQVRPSIGCAILAGYEGRRGGYSICEDDVARRTKGIKGQASLSWRLLLPPRRIDVSSSGCDLSLSNGCLRLCLSLLCCNLRSRALCARLRSRRGGRGVVVFERLCHCQLHSGMSIEALARRRCIVVCGAVFRGDFGSSPRVGLHRPCRREAMAVVRLALGMMRRRRARHRGRRARGRFNGEERGEEEGVQSQDVVSSPHGGTAGRQRGPGRRAKASHARNGSLRQHTKENMITLNQSLWVLSLSSRRAHA